MSQTNWEDDDSSEKEDFSSVQLQRKKVILLLDVDCFEVQLWMKKLCPELIGKDVPVVVINSDEIILSVNYTAKSLGVERGENRLALINARSKCENAGVQLIEIVAGERYGKVDTFLPQTESDLILDAIFRYADMQRDLDDSPYMPITVERNGKDEFYIDMTQCLDEEDNENFDNSADPFDHCSLCPAAIYDLNRLKNHPNSKYKDKPRTVMEGRKEKIIGQKFSYRVLEVYPHTIAAYHLDELRLVQGAISANAFIGYIKSQTGYDVSAGVGHSKLIVKLACGRNKPNGITIITDISLPRLSKSISFQDLPGYGGPDGQRIRNMLLSELKKDAKSIHDLLRTISSDHENLVPIMEKLNFHDPITRSMDLSDMCQFKDISVVMPRVYYARFSTGLSFNDFAGRLDLFKAGVWNLSKDMKSRINYFKRRGRNAKELVVKADVITNAQVLPGDYANKISIPGTSSVTPDWVKDFVWNYIDQNYLNFYEITRINLTAGNIVDG